MWTNPLLMEVLSLHGLVVVIGLLVYVFASHTLQQRRNPTAAIGWVLVIVFIPYVGLPLYLLFGTRKLVRSRSYPQFISPDPDIATDAAWPRQLAAAMGQPPAESYQDLHIHADGAQALQALWGVIDSAERELNLCSFIIGRDAMGDALLARLIGKARAGIKVRVAKPERARISGREYRFVCSSVAFADQGPFQSARPPQAGGGRRRAPVVRRTQFCCGIF